MNKSSEPIIEISNLTFKYRKETVLKDINLKIYKNDFLSIIGPNGGGKSTFLKLILGLLKPTSGEIKIYGQPPFASRLKLGYVPQDTNINKNFPIKVLDTVLQGRLGISKKLWGYNQNDINIAKKMLKVVKAYDFLNNKIGELSGGQRQRVFIARALATDADILLLDEPTSSIDSKGQIELYSILKELNKRKCIISVSHNLSVALGFANKVAYIDKTLYLHDSPAKDKAKILQKIGGSSSHICPIELIVDDEMCLHKKGEKDV